MDRVHRHLDAAKVKYRDITRREDVTNHHAAFIGPALFLFVLLIVFI
jgi:hypothetical protein